MCVLFSVACTENLTETDAYITRSFASLALDPAEEYKMGNKRRGLALIFNQERFFWRLGLNDRHGTNADRYNLEKRLQELNFEARSYDNYKQEEVLDKICEAAEEDHSDADCFLLVFLSHGENDHVYTYDGKINIQLITAMFKGDKCKSLAGKPKIFILQVHANKTKTQTRGPIRVCQHAVDLLLFLFSETSIFFYKCSPSELGHVRLQACRGDKHDDPVTVCDAVDNELKTNEVVVDASAVHTLPAGADFIMCYSVAEGYYSHRETINGSWYIQDLCEILRNYGDSLEFTELLTLVNRKVSMRAVGNSSDPIAIGKKQVPCFASMLTKKLYFKPNK
ncbi:caspase-6-like isoform X2 [Brachyistius frenatus]|uniref:caspase-6-like isoform X2 n=1 Tax=Brachyistius frenatus TaxID=100188 RepID=UPI0037E9AE26